LVFGGKPRWKMTSRSAATHSTLPPRDADRAVEQEAMDGAPVDDFELRRFGAGADSCPRCSRTTARRGTGSRAVWGARPAPCVTGRKRWRAASRDARRESPAPRCIVAFSSYIEIANAPACITR
jgi:hypothetical protein